MRKLRISGHRGQDQQMLDLLDAATLRACFSWNDPETDMYACVHTVHYKFRHAEIRGTIFNSSGEKIGDFNRLVHCHKDSTDNTYTLGNCHNNGLYLRPAWRGLGFTRRWTPVVRENLKALGVPAITINASWMHGPYAWARMGFTNAVTGTNIWKNSDLFANAEQYLRRAKKNGLPPELYAQARKLLDSQTSPSDLIPVADFGKEHTWRDWNNEHLGKALLRFAAWRGEYSLQ